MNNSRISRGLMLEVPYAEKDEAKHLGAKWDPDMRKWFVPKGCDMKLFYKWIDKEKDVHFITPSENT